MPFPRSKILEENNMSKHTTATQEYDKMVEAAVPKTNAFALADLRASTLEWTFHMLLNLRVAWNEIQHTPKEALIHAPYKAALETLIAERDKGFKKD